ncbi:MAG: YceI family protein, partial [Candidatus Sedimenticola sp. 6PFRAG1]
KSLKTSGFLVKQMLKSNDFLDVKNYPDVIFASKHLHWQSPNQGILEGTLTLRGVTRPVAFQVDLADIDALTINDAEQIEMKATTTIQRSEFGMTAFPNLAEDEVDLSIQLVAARYANQVN